MTRGSSGGKQPPTTSSPGLATTSKASPAKPRRLNVRGPRSRAADGTSPQAVATLARRAATVWLALFALAFLNGALREVMLVHVLGVWPHVAQQLSALTGILLFTGCVWALWPWMRPRTLAAACVVGTAWLAATALTETFLLNMWLGGMTLSQVALEYDVSQGKLWPLVLAWIGLLPPMVHCAYPFGLEGVLGRAPLRRS